MGFGLLRKELMVAVFAIAVVVLASLFAISAFFGDPDAKKGLCYVGVAFCGNTTREAEMLIDRMRNYTNLFILQSGPVSRNETATNEICDYAVNAGLSVVVYFGDLNPAVLTNETMWRVSWINTAKTRFGDKLLGVYYYDEPGGLFLDTNWSFVPVRVRANLTYDLVAENFVRNIRLDPGVVALKTNSLPIFVSDYALYWFDYLAGYDVVLAQVGWNHSYAQDIALVRGAAKLQNKEWGVMITWKYNEPPYLDSALNIYAQMVEAYKAGAKYITVFNYPQREGNDYGVLTDEHFSVLERFWLEVVNNPRVAFGSTEVEAVLVLPNLGFLGA